MRCHGSRGDADRNGFARQINGWLQVDVGQLGLKAGPIRYESEVRLPLVGQRRFVFVDGIAILDRLQKLRFSTRCGIDGIVQRLRVRGEFKTWRDSFAGTPRKADYAWTTLARVMSFAKDRGTIATNPCEKGGRLYSADRTDKVWGEPEIAAVLSVASAEIKLALVLALWTGQRQGDLLRLPWSSYDGSHLRLRQSKTGRRIAMPAGMPLKVLLDSTERRSPLVLTNSYGRPWTSDGFRTSWSKTCARAGVAGLTFHDLRGSAVVRLALAEATVPQIATFTGHSLKDVEAILDAHYLGRDIQLAEAAVLKLEKRTKLQNDL